jgi:diguanylate cyclase (GGDEF)-like protein
LKPARRSRWNRRGTVRRLTSHVLRPAAILGLLLVLGAAAAITLSARRAAVDAVDARAATFHDLAQASVRRSGRIAQSTAAAARAQHVRLRLVGAERPLAHPGRVLTRDGVRTYTFTLAKRGPDRRLRVSVPAADVRAATVRALALSLGGGLVLLLVLGAVAVHRLRRMASRPLGRLADAVERMAAGEPARPGDVHGAAEVRAIAARLEGVAQTLGELTAQATTDPLTGVGNRRSFHTSLEAELKRAERSSTQLTLVLIDLDGFKEINDTHGHPFGDGVLQTIAENVRASLRSSDVLARIGGDEFAVLLPDTPRESAHALVQRARTDATASVGGVRLTWSAGVASFPADARDAVTLVECADAALYCAKASGRASIYDYDPELTAPRADGDRATVEGLLAKPDAVVPVFQPLVALATGQVAGYEALARFPHPPARRPDEWFAVAQRVGLGAALEARAVLAAIEPARRPAGTFLSFNLSASALLSDEAIAALPPDLSDIVIEITENERVGADEQLARRLEPLRRRGARIAVDEAGAGYSGLQQVMRIQPDIIKLDRSLVANVDTDPAKAALIDSFVRFARRTGASVCAEGIETPEELRVLADLDVTYGQGFGLARPAVPWAPVAPWVAAAVRHRGLPTGGPADAGDSRENADLRLASLTSRLANIRSADELHALTAPIAAELEAEAVAIVRRGAAAATLEPLSDQPWLPHGTVLALTNYPALRQIVATQQVVQVLASDATADLGELSLLERSGFRSMLLAPLVAHGEVAGVLVLLAAAERAWTRLETSRARIVGHQLGAVLDTLAGPARVVALRAVSPSP